MMSFQAEMQPPSERKQSFCSAPMHQRRPFLIIIHSYLLHYKLLCFYSDNVIIYGNLFYDTPLLGGFILFDLLTGRRGWDATSLVADHWHGSRKPFFRRGLSWTLDHRTRTTHIRLVSPPSRSCGRVAETTNRSQLIWVGQVPSNVTYCVHRVLSLVSFCSLLHFSNSTIIVQVHSISLHQYVSLSPYQPSGSPR